MASELGKAANCTFRRRGSVRSCVEGSVTERFEYVTPNARFSGRRGAFVRSDTIPTIAGKEARARSTTTSTKT
eukprot:scaffold285_cov330-Pavlova_lutheri.AAC.65